VVAIDVQDLRIAVMRVARRLRTERASDATTPSQMAALATLTRQGPMSPGELAAAERVRPPSMTRILNSLQEADMVTRVTHPTDRRQVLYEITPRAREMLRQDRQRRDLWLSQRLSTLSDQERATLEQAIPILNRIALD
jgi:DNA-binding MarR family transcriptional regulator